MCGGGEMEQVPSLHYGFMTASLCLGCVGGQGGREGGRRGQEEGERSGASRKTTSFLHSYSSSRLALSPSPRRLAAAKDVCLL